MAGLFNRKRKKKNKNVEISCVYASPQIMSDHTLSIDENIPYPFNYAQQANIIKFCMHCGKKAAPTTDPNETAILCQNCLRGIPFIDQPIYCPYCGKSLY